MTPGQSSAIFLFVKSGQRGSVSEAEEVKPTVTVEEEKQRAAYGTANAKRIFSDKKIDSLVERIHWNRGDSVDVVKDLVVAMPPAAKAKMVRTPEFIEYLEAFAVDVLMGAKKPTKEEWAAHQFLSKHLAMSGRVGKSKKGVDGKNADSMMDADVVVEAEGGDAS